MHPKGLTVVTHTWHTHTQITIHSEAFNHMVHDHDIPQVYNTTTIYAHVLYSESK